MRSFVLDTPASDRLGDLTAFQGWLIAPPGLAVRLSLGVDGEPYAAVRHGSPRPDVAAAYPGVRGAADSGFSGDLWLSMSGRDRVRVELRQDGGGGEVLFARTFACRQDAPGPRLRERSFAPVHDLLACPDCRGLVSGWRAPATCAACGTRVFLRGGTPHLLEPNTLPLVRATETSATHAYNPRARQLIAAAAPGLVLDLGAGNPQASDRHPHVVCYDVLQYAPTDVVSNRERLPFRDGLFETVISMSVFEHVPDPRGLAAEAWRVMTPGGTIYVDTAFLQPLHGDPGHFFNMTVAALRRVMVDFEEVEAGVGSWPAAGLAMQIETALPHVRRGPWRERLERLLEELRQDGAALDQDLGDRGREVLAASVFYLGRKPA